MIDNWRGKNKNISSAELLCCPVSPLHSSPAIVLGARVTGCIFIEATSTLSSLAASPRDLELSRMQWSAVIGLVISCLASSLAIPGQGQGCGLLCITPS